MHSKKKIDGENNLGWYALGKGYPEGVVGLRG